MVDIAKNSDIMSQMAHLAATGQHQATPSQVPLQVPLLDGKSLDQLGESFQQSVDNLVKDGKLSVTSTLHAANAETITAESFMNKFDAAVLKTPNYNFDGTDSKVVDETGILLALKNFVNQQEAHINMGIREKYSDGVIDRVVAGLGDVPDNVKSIVNEFFIRALQKNPELGEPFEEVIRYYKAKAALQGLAKSQSKSPEQIEKLTNLLRRVSPVEATTAFLSAKLVGKLENLDFKSLKEGAFEPMSKWFAELKGKIFNQGEKGLDFSDPLGAAEALSTANTQSLVESAKGLRPLAHQAVDKSINWAEQNSGFFSEIVSTVQVVLGNFARTIQELITQPNVNANSMKKPSAASGDGFTMAA